MNILVNIDSESETLIASIDGYETYRTKTVKADGSDVGEVLTGFYVEAKSDVDGTWATPEDVDIPAEVGFHTEFDGACIEIMERLTEHARHENAWHGKISKVNSPRTEEQKAVEANFMGNVLDIFKGYVLKRLDQLPHTDDDHFDFLMDCLKEFEEISDDVNLEASKT